MLRVLVDGHVAAGRVDAEPLRDRVEDAHVGLVADEQVDVVDRPDRPRSSTACDGGDHAGDGVAVDVPAAHASGSGRASPLAASTGLRVPPASQSTASTGRVPSAPSVERADAARPRRGTSTAAPAPSPNRIATARSVGSTIRVMRLGADEQHGRVPGRAERAADPQARSRTPSTPRRGRTRPPRSRARRRRSAPCRGPGGRGWWWPRATAATSSVPTPGVGERRLAGLDGEVGGRLLGRGDVTLRDAGPRTDPLVGGVERPPRGRRWSRPARAGRHRARRCGRAGRRCTARRRPSAADPEHGLAGVHRLAGAGERTADAAVAVGADLGRRRRRPRRGRRRRRGATSVSAARGR